MSWRHVRDAIATHFGGPPVPGDPNAHRGAGVDGLGTVFARKPKRYDASAHFVGQPTSGGARPRSGAIAVVGVNAVQSERVSPPRGSGILRKTYEGVLHCYHLSYAAESEEAEADFEDFMEACENRLRADPTLGGVVFSAGEGDGHSSASGRVAWRLHDVKNVGERTEVTADLLFTVIEFTTG